MLLNECLVSWSHDRHDLTLVLCGIKILVEIDTIRFLWEMLNSHNFGVDIVDKLLIKNWVRQDFSSVVFSTESSSLIFIKEFQYQVFELRWVFVSCGRELCFLSAISFIAFLSKAIIRIGSLLEMERSIFTHKLENHDSDRPPIWHSVIFLHFNDFWSPSDSRTYFIITKLIFLKFSCNSKITKFKVSLPINQNVSMFDVSVN